MKVLVTGAKGFVGKNLCHALKNVLLGKDRSRPNLNIDEVFEFDLNNSVTELERFCSQADFVFNLAGVNRPTDPQDFNKGNVKFSNQLLETLKKCNNKCPIMLSSSIQASLEGRFNGEYGKSKRLGEELFFDYQKEVGANIYVYRFPNLFGKWCKPNYNSVVATFCYNVARDLPITVNDPSVKLELLFIDDLVVSMLDLLEGKMQRCDFDGGKVVLSNEGRYCTVLNTHLVTLGEIVEHLKSFNAQPKTLIIPEIPYNSFAKKLYSTFLSYLPKDKIAFPLKMNVDERGSFTEIIKTLNNGQFSVNVSKPGVKKGEHWHNQKWEFFVVVSGKALIQQRQIDGDEVLEFRVSGEKVTAVHMLPGYTHNIINLSESQNLVTLMWANESFDKSKPDTFFLEV